MCTLPYPLMGGGLGMYGTLGTLLLYKRIYILYIGYRGCSGIVQVCCDFLCTTVPPLIVNGLKGLSYCPI